MPSFAAPAQPNALPVSAGRLPIRSSKVSIDHLMQADRRIYEEESRPGRRDLWDFIVLDYDAIEMKTTAIYIQRVEYEGGLDVST